MIRSYPANCYPYDPYGLLIPFYVTSVNNMLHDPKYDKKPKPMKENEEELQAGVNYLVVRRADERVINNFTKITRLHVSNVTDKCYFFHEISQFLTPDAIVFKEEFHEIYKIVEKEAKK